MAVKINNIPLLSDRLRALLKMRNLTMTGLARQMNITDRQVRNYFQYEMINKESLVEIAKIVDCNPFYLTDPDCSLLPFASYESFNYNYDDCVRGLLHMQQYAPGDYSKEELEVLKKMLGVQVDRFSSWLNKKRREEQV